MEAMSADDEVPSAWEQLKQIGESERHFNELERTYRALASTWLLATFAGMGFVFEATGLPVQREAVVYAISIAGSIGIQLIWVVDLLAYHKLLQAFFIEGLRIELENPEFPQARWNMRDFAHSVEERVMLFYFGCSVAPLPFGVVALATHYPLGSLSTLFGAVGALFLGLTAVALVYKSKDDCVELVVRELSTKREQEVHGTSLTERCEKRRHR